MRARVWHLQNQFNCHHTITIAIGELTNTGTVICRVQGISWILAAANERSFSVGTAAGLAGTRRCSIPASGSAFIDVCRQQQHNNLVSRPRPLQAAARHCQQCGHQAPCVCAKLIISIRCHLQWCWPVDSTSEAKVEANSPTHFFLVLSRLYPLPQLHVKEPGTLVQLLDGPVHGDDKHSSTSAHKPQCGMSAK